MVLSHIFGLIPLCLAMRQQLPLTTGFIAAALIASTFYHLFGEETVLGRIDTTLATCTFVWTLLLVALSLTFKVSWILLVISLLFGVLAIASYKLGHETDLPAAAVDRLHTMWHLFAFLAMAAVILNLHRGPETRFAAPKTWLRAVQEFPM